MYKVKTLNAISPVYETVLNMGDYAFDAYAENRAEKLVNKPDKGQFAKAGVENARGIKAG